jgi:hypothetical protein
MNHDGTPFELDRLSERARRALRLNVSSAYNELVPRQPGPHEARTLLELLDPTNVLHATPKRRDDAAAALSALWLWHDFLEESHALSQQLHGSSGSFWHAIMHRREGDFSNSKYWYARCAVHPVHPSLAAQVDELIKPYPADKSLLRLTSGGWNPSGFVDLVEQVHDRPDDPRHALAVSVQHAEWRVLFDHCVRSALE